MDNHVILLLLVFCVLALTGTSVGVALILSSIITVIVADIPIFAVIHNVITGVDSFTMLAIPLFIYVAAMMNHFGITNDMIAFSTAIVGRARGGLAYVNVMVSMLFAGMSGSAVADSSGIGKVLIPAMISRDYNKGFTVGITAVSSVIGAIIPPSIILVIYGVFTETSIGDLFLAGAIPGFIYGLLQFAYVYIFGLKGNLPKGEEMTGKERLFSVLKALPVLPIPIILIGGIMFGLFTPTEAASVAAIYTLLVAFPSFGKLNLKNIMAALDETIVLAGSIMFVVAGSIAFGWLLSYFNFAESISQLLVRTEISQYQTFTLVCIVFLLLGLFLGVVEIIIIFSPVIMAMQKASGIDPVHFGIVICIILTLGMVTPPYGICLLITAKLGNIDTVLAFKHALPIVLIGVILVIGIIIFPNMAMYLPTRF